MDIKLFVIGGANVDLYGQIDAKNGVSEDSNPGSVTIHAGGVGRNIAENLGYLGANVEFIGHFGGDNFAITLNQSLEKAGVSTAFSYKNADQNSDFYIAIQNQKGELISAVNDMYLIENLPTSFLKNQENIKKIKNADMVVLDGNLSEKMLTNIFRVYGKNSVIAVDSVSTAKAKRLIPHLAKIDYLKCNKAEANMLISQNENLNLQQITERLIKLGVGTAIISDSLAGFGVATDYKFHHFSAKDIESSNSSGAGDALFSGFLYAICKGRTPFEAAQFARSAAEKALGFNGPVNPKISELSKFLS